MKMRKLIYLFIASSALASCDKKLDLAPRQSISQDQALLTEGDVKVTLVGAYDGMQAATVYGGEIMTLGELTGNLENIRFTGTFAGLSDAYRAEMTTNNTFARDTWAQAYNVINRANNVLSAVDKVTSSTTERNRIEGEALFIRSSMFFELVKMFGKAWGDGNNATNPGIPLVLTATSSITEADYRSRNSVAEVYAKVIEDLTKAESLLPASNGIYATKNAAAAQLSRVAMMQGNYAAARDAANRVITSGRHTLSTTFEGLWFTYLNNAGNSPSEYIFSMKVTNQDGANAMNTYFGIATPGIPGTAGRGDCKIQNAHLAKYEAADVRGKYFVVVGGNNYTRKHLDRFGNVLIVRLGEMYLTRAEANFRLGTSTGATPLSDVNTIRKRAGLADLGTVTLDNIINERFLELAFEGQYLHDMKRTRKSLSGLAWNSPKLIFPIPQREMDVNKNLVQNEGY
jgi:starch-binding outer membrane protein, SusD/RagB family